jgi:hypothetical protein
VTTRLAHILRGGTLKMGPHLKTPVQASFTNWMRFFPADF